jgi:hypothetical protein
VKPQIFFVRLSAGFHPTESYCGFCEAPRCRRSDRERPVTGVVVDQASAMGFAFKPVDSLDFAAVRAKRAVGQCQSLEIGQSFGLVAKTWIGDFHG